MSKRGGFFLFYLLFFVILLRSSPAYAYIGPAIVFIGYLFGPIGALIAGILMILSFPFLKLYRKFCKKKEEGTEADNKEDDAP